MLTDEEASILLSEACAEWPNSELLDVLIFDLEIEDDHVIFDAVWRAADCILGNPYKPDFDLLMCALQVDKLMEGT